MNRLGISDLDDQLYEEGKEAGLESALMVTSFGADEEFYGEYPAKYYQTDEDEEVFIFLLRLLLCSRKML